MNRWAPLALVSAALSGAAVTAIRAARRTDGPWEIFGAFCLFGLFATGPFALHAWRPPTPLQWGLLLAVGLLSLAAQILFTHALRVARAAVAGVIMQLTPITALILGVTLDGDRLGPVALAGCAITLAGVSWAALRMARPSVPSGEAA
jgi:drug/metabolite transporter (DMT)-like permease